VNAESNLVDSYFLADGRLSWTSGDDDWQVSLNVANIFDKYYVLTMFDQRFASGLVGEVPGRPRTWSLTVKRNFGAADRAPVQQYVAPPEPVATYKQCLNGTVVAMDATCPPPPPPPQPAAQPVPPAPQVEPTGERG
jgi:hypothetical protein